MNDLYACRNLTSTTKSYGFISKLLRLVLGPGKKAYMGCIIGPLTPLHHTLCPIILFYQFRTNLHHGKKRFRSYNPQITSHTSWNKIIYNYNKAFCMKLGIHIYWLFYIKKKISSLIINKFERTYSINIKLYLIVRPKKAINPP